MPTFKDAIGGALKDEVLRRNLIKATSHSLRLRREVIEARIPIGRPCGRKPAPSRNGVWMRTPRCGNRRDKPLRREAEASPSFPIAPM